MDSADIISTQLSGVTNMSHLPRLGRGRAVAMIVAGGGGGGAECQTVVSRS